MRVRYRKFGVLVTSSVRVAAQRGKRQVVLPTAALLQVASAGVFDFHPGPLTAEEQELKSQNLIMEVYQPHDHSDYAVASVKVVGKGVKGKSVKVLVCNFGIENVEKARAQGREMKGFHYTPAMAHQFLFAQGWDESHDRFYTRAYVQEGMNGYNGQ